MNTDDLRRRLAEHRAELDEFGVAELLVFGSVARNEAGPDSDVDLLVRFSRPTGLFGLIRLKRFLEAIVERPVDLATEGALRPWMKDAVMREAIRAA